MQGDSRVDELMRPVSAAVERHIKNSDAITDIYNRAYEAVYISIDEIDSLCAEVERLRGAIWGAVADCNHMMRDAKTQQQFWQVLDRIRDNLNYRAFGNDNDALKGDK